MKAIILSRCSTVNQSTEQQTKELVETAIKDGYKKSDLIIIENKESAIKNDEMHRLGLVEMKEAIQNDPSINCVYVREVSRIGRRYDVLSSIKTFLVTNKIQLIVNGNTRVELLDKDKNITLLGSIMFEIACSNAISEMEDKKIRFAQGKAKAMREGKIASGKPIFGYYTDDNGIIQINEVEAETIKYIFNTYVNTDFSTKAIYRELVAQGKMKRYNNEETGRFQIQRIINNLAYSGGVSNASGANIKPTQINHYQAIVTEELQQKAIDKCKSAKSLCKSITKNIYYAKSLVKCTCGHTMVANSSSRSYVCPYCKRTVPINQIDYIAWSEAQVIKSLQMVMDSSSDKAKAELTIKDNQNKIVTAKNRLEELDELEVNVIDSSLNISNKEKREAFVTRKLSDVTSERKKLNQTILHLEEVNKQLNDYLQDIDDKNFFNPIAVEDDAARKEIITSVIDSITIEDIDDKHIKIVVNPKKSAYPFDWTTYYIYDKTTLPYPRLIRHSKELVQDVTKEVVQRFKSVSRTSKKVLIKKMVA